MKIRRWLGRPFNQFWIFLAVGVAAAAAVACMPAYRQYVEQEQTDTCFSAMYSTAVWYHLAVEEKEAEGIAESQINYGEILCDTVRDNFGRELTENADGSWYSNEICHGGGTWTLQLDPETHRVSIQCTNPTHIWFTDQITEKELNDFRKNGNPHS